MAKSRRTNKQTTQKEEDQVQTEEQTVDIEQEEVQESTDTAQEETVKQEETPEPVPEQQEEKPENKEESKPSVSVMDVLTKKGVKPEDKIKEIIDNADKFPTKQVLLVTTMFDYNKSSKPGAPMSNVEKEMAMKNQNLYNTIKSAINVKDYDEFKLNMDIIHMVFKTYAQEAFNHFKLMRGTAEWNGGEKALNTFINLATVFSLTADKAKRTEQLKTISLDKALDQEKTELNDKVITSIKKYYSE